MAQRVEDIHQWEMKANATIQNLDIRLTQLENLSEQISNSLQRFLDTQDLDDDDEDSRSPSAESDAPASASDRGSPSPPTPPPLAQPPAPPSEPSRTPEKPDEERISSIPSVVVALTAPEPCTTAAEPLARQGSGRRRATSVRRRNHARLSRQLTLATNDVFDQASLRRKNFQRWQSVCQPDGGGGSEGQIPATQAPTRPSRLERGMSCVSRWTEPRTSSTRAPFLSALRGEYTSITDELESTACLLPPPESPTSPAPTPMVAAIAAETEILRDAEAADYQMMGGLIQRRLNGDDPSLEELSDFGDDSDVEQVVGSGSRRLMIKVTPAPPDDGRRGSFPGETSC